MSEEKPSLLEFPCQFPIKAMGKSNVEFDMIVMEIVGQHVDELKEGSIKTRPSKKGNFVSVTITIEAMSQQQLDSIYLQLNAHPLVLMVL